MKDRNDILAGLLRQHERDVRKTLAQRPDWPRAADKFDTLFGHMATQRTRSVAAPVRKEPFEQIARISGNGNTNEFRLPFRIATSISRYKGSMSAFRLGFIRYVLLVAVFLGSALVMPNAAPIQQSATNKQPDQSDPWKALRLFIGKWEGDSQGQPGSGKMEREYAFVLKNRFVQVSNKAVYPPQEKNPKGETHEDLGFFGYDRGLKKLILRQFHIEGFVIQYSLESISEDGRSFVFTSTAIENIAPGGVARETYRFLSNDEFVETFALAGPGKEFETYSESRFRRKR